MEKLLGCSGVLNSFESCRVCVGERRKRNMRERGTYHIEREVAGRVLQLATVYQ